MKTGNGGNDSSDKLSRRKFIGTLGASTAGLLFVPHFKASGSLAHAADGGSSYLAQVAITQADNYDRTLIKQKVQHLFESIGGIGDIVKAGDKVAIKLNLTGGSGSATNPRLGGKPITESMWTHPEVLRAVAELIIDCGVNGNDIYFVDSLWDAASYNNFGYLDVQQNLGAQMVDLNKKDPYPDFIDLTVGTQSSFYTSFRVNQILKDADVYVSIPKMKQHYEAGVTGALKNQIGMVPKDLYTMPNDTGSRQRLHKEGGQSNTHLPRSICDLNFARPVHLGVIDGIKNARGGEGVWNPTFRLAEDHVLLAGKNPVATDSIMAYLMGNDPQAAKTQLPGGGQCDNYLEILHQKGMGTNQMSEIEVVGDGAGLVTSVPPRYEAAIPDDFALYQNFPNPFNPSTTFKFHVPVAEYVTVKIYSITGREVETLLEGQVSQGLHELRWTPNGIASGVYLCTMHAGGFSDSRKMIYQK
jgi:uncharacterized protein (DUF362 family)